MLNSDNINVTGESFDYGPWRFAPEWDEGFTAAYFDHAGLYAFGRQPEAIQWDVAQLAGCLALIGDAPALSDRLATWPARFEAALFERLLARLGVAPRGEDDRELVSALLDALRTRAVGIDRLFFDWRGGRVPADPLYAGAPFDRLAAALAGRERPLDPRLLARRRALLDADRGGRGDLGGDRRARRLGPVRGQDRRDPPHGSGDARRSPRHRTAGLTAARRHGSSARVLELS